MSSGGATRDILYYHFNTFPIILLHILNKELKYNGYFSFRNI